METKQATKCTKEQGPSARKCRRSIMDWEIASVIIIFFSGSLFHFLYELTGEWKPIAVIGAVNESVWEHLKLAFWPAVFFMFLEYKLFKKKVNNFLVAKAVSLFTMPVVIIAGFYGYTALLGTHALAMDLVIFLGAILLGQFLGFKIFMAKEISRKWTLIAMIAIIAMIAMFSLLTYFPPRVFLFQDSETGGFGFVEHVH